MRLENYSLILLLVIIIFILLSGISKPLENINYEYGTYIEYINSRMDSMEILGKNEKGGVIKMGPLGNKSSSIKIAFIIGVHPLERNSHLAVLEGLLINKGDLKNCYYIYGVVVKENPADYEKSRINGQSLGYRYMVPDIVSNNFNFVIDVHSNRGSYPKKVFVFSALPDKKSNALANFLVKNLIWLDYYTPPRSSEPTSTPYISEPLLKKGVPTLVYETYIFEPYSLTEKKAQEFISVLDDYEGLDF